MLMNMVRMRFFEPPMFLELAQVISSYTFEASASISAMVTFAPSRTNAFAVAFAMPAPAPVRNATLPSSLPNVFSVVQLIE